jgi:CRISPR system Cascade subunit CasB
MNAPDYQKQNADFVAQLVKLCKDDRGHRAALRRWWSDGTRHYAYPVLGRLTMGVTDVRRSMVAAIYATHSKEGKTPHKERGTSIGHAALRLGKRNEKGEHPYDHHFRRLLACSTTTELGPLLNRFVKRLSTNDDGYVSLDYVVLLGDFRRFNSNPQAVKTQWAKDFWKVEEADHQPETPTNP